MTVPGTSTSPAKSRTRWHAFLVASGIMLSRIAGLIRESVFAYFFGNSDAADALKAAFRIPNLLQNLFGEGVLSASFIPVYARLLAHGDREEAERVAGGVSALLMTATSILVLIGVLATPWIINLVTPGFEGTKRDLCIVLVRILFPGAGLLVWSAWCLGILNSHGKFFLSYTAPVLWNAVIIATLIAFGGRTGQEGLAEWVAWGSVAGSLAQLLIQLPTVMGLLSRFSLSLDHRISHVRTVVRNFVPVFFSRGVVQISSYIDAMLASFLPTGAVAAFTYAQILYTLPVSIFGMSVSAAELPAMSRATGSEAEMAGYLRKRLNAGLRQIAFFIVPSGMAFFALGDVITAALYQRGEFSASDSMYVWVILAGSAVGLLASTMGRLYSSAFYALQDTRTPLRCAVVRVSLAALMGFLASQYLPGLIGIDRRFGAAGITAASGLAGWVEFLLLRRSLNRRIGRSGIPLAFTVKLWAAAGAGAVAAWAVKLSIPQLHPIPQALLVLCPYGIVYFSAAFLLKIPEVRFIGRITGRFMPFLRK